MFKFYRFIKLYLIVCVAFLHITPYAVARKIVTDLEVSMFAFEAAAQIIDQSSEKGSRPAIYIVEDKSLNAFANNQLIGIHTGLFANVETSNGLYGVVAHEVAHYACNHIFRFVNKSENASEYKGASSSMLALSILAAPVMAAVAPALAVSAAAAVAMGASFTPLLRNFTFIREHENEADLMAVEYMYLLGRPPGGLTEVMQQMLSESIRIRTIDPYWRTHPLEEDRISNISVAENKYKGMCPQISDFSYNSDYCQIERSFRRVKSKILNTYPNHRDPKGSLDSPHHCLKQKDYDFIHQYGLIFSHYRAGDTNYALKLTDLALAKNQDDLYLKDTRAEILLDLGRYDEAMTILFANYRSMTNVFTAIRMIQGLMKVGDPMKNLEALYLAQLWSEKHPNNIFLKSKIIELNIELGDAISAQYVEAEILLMYGKYREARKKAIMAKKALMHHKNHPKYKPMMLKIQDIIDVAEALYKKH